MIEKQISEYIKIFGRNAIMKTKKIDGYNEIFFNIDVFNSLYIYNSNTNSKITGISIFTLSKKTNEFDLVGTWSYKSFETGNSPFKNASEYFASVKNSMSKDMYFTIDI